MNNVTKVRIVYECSIIGIVLLTFLKGMFPYMGAWWRVAYGFTCRTVVFIVLSETA